MEEGRGKGEKREWRGVKGDINEDENDDDNVAILELFLSFVALFPFWAKTLCFVENTLFCRFCHQRRLLKLESTRADLPTINCAFMY